MKQGAYLVGWLTIFITGIFTADLIFPRLVDGLDTFPAAVVATMSWLPMGFLMITLGVTKPAPSGGMRMSAGVAVAGLIIAGQYPVVLQKRRNSSSDYLAAANTDTGEALLSGCAWGIGPVLAWTLLFMIVRRVISGKKFKDTSWNEEPRTRRVFVVGALVASLIGLAVSVVTL